MKIERDAELAMLELEVLPKLEKARECLRAGKELEADRIIAHDLLGVFRPYKESELAKFDNAPDNLKESPKVERMWKNAQMYQKAIDLLWDEEGKDMRPISEGTLDAVKVIVEGIMRS